MLASVQLLRAFVVNFNYTEFYVKTLSFTETGFFGDMCILSTDHVHVQCRSNADTFGIWQLQFWNDNQHENLWHDGNVKEEIIFRFLSTGAISPLFLYDCKSMNLKEDSENRGILGCTCSYVPMRMSVCVRVCEWVCVYAHTREWDEQKQTYRQNGWSHKGPAQSPESVWLETNHHFNVLTKPL